MSGWSRLWCRLTFRHRGQIDVLPSGPFWMCDNCGAVRR